MFCVWFVCLGIFYVLSAMPRPIFIIFWSAVVYCQLRFGHLVYFMCFSALSILYPCPPCIIYMFCLPCLLQAISFVRLVVYFTLFCPPCLFYVSFLPCLSYIGLPCPPCLFYIVLSALSISYPLPALYICRPYVLSALSIL